MPLYSPRAFNFILSAAVSKFLFICILKNLQTKTNKQKHISDFCDCCLSIFFRYKSNEEYVYVRGRGRGKYICEECGIRCKKPSMLRKHIRTHSDVRPYHCAHCNFSFKTKGGLECGVFIYTFSIYYISCLYYTISTSFSITFY